MYARKSVLGIDAAWTAGAPSGVALASERDGDWQLDAVAASYSDFIAMWEGRPTVARAISSIPIATQLIEAAASLSGKDPDLVSVDMPLARFPITGRRVSDDAISTEYGSRHASTHSPSATRPGQISDNLTSSFAAAGYPLMTEMPLNSAALIECYPHPAFVEFGAADRRYPYKWDKRRRYWPQASTQQRKIEILQIWHELRGLLENEISGVKDALVLPDSDQPSHVFKAFEDELDAICCAAVAICVLEGRARAFGDDDSAIWVPNQNSAKLRRIASDLPISVSHSYSVKTPIRKRSMAKDDEVLVYLAQVAQTGPARAEIPLVTYGELAAKFGGSPIGWGARLTPLVYRMRNAGLPLLPVLVVSKGKKMPPPNADVYIDLGLNTEDKLIKEQLACVNHDWSSLIKKGRV